MELKKSFAATEEKFANAECRKQEFQLNKEIPEDRGIRADEPENKLKCFEEHVCFRVYKVFEQSNALFGKYPSSGRSHEHVVVLEMELSSMRADIRGFIEQHTVDNGLLYSVCTAHTLQMIASRQRVSTCRKDLEKLLADKTAVEAELRKVPADM